MTKDDRASERLDDLRNQRAELAHSDARSDSRGRAGTRLMVALGILGLIVGAIGFTVGYVKTRDQANAGLSLAQQIDALCTAQTPAAPPPQASKLCSDAEEVIQGDPGPVGDQGPVGPQGPAGPQGPQGIGQSGPQGPEGPIGVQGPRGPAGPQGDQGNQGLQGQGDTGPQGLPGERGPEGPAGPRGEAGQDGANGAPGLDGQDGESAFPFSFSFTTTDLMGAHTFTVTCTAPGACESVET